MLPRALSLQMQCLILLLETFFLLEICMFITESILGGHVVPTFCNLLFPFKYQKPRFILIHALLGTVCNGDTRTCLGGPGGSARCEERHWVNVRSKKTGDSHRLAGACSQDCRVDVKGFGYGR